MTQHTPGPWTVSDELTTDKHFVIDLGPNVSGCILIERHREGFDASDEANARLIAAAPGMLDGLKQAVKQIADDWASTSTPLDGHRALIDKLDAIIAKAEGRS